MSHITRGQVPPEKIKRHNSQVRLDDNDKNGLRRLIDEYPLYTESVILRAALQALLACSGSARSAIVLASLTDRNVGEVMRQQGMAHLTTEGRADD
ncbi:hypothetical protein N7605_17920 [Pantoea ananatis]|uniref:hypothetical protein n=1 Tax=Pantoea ananas TaxID=553 RepID=UPI00287CA841|nr:hypothetical protein [Pantoea ananatis]MDS7721680.1 hypothetical protein [Pantoea ananatis]